MNGLFYFLVIGSLALALPLDLLNLLSCAPSLQAGAACTNRLCPKSETEGAWDLAEVTPLGEADHEFEFHHNFPSPTFSRLS